MLNNKFPGIFPIIDYHMTTLTAFKASFNLPQPGSGRSAQLKYA